MTTIVIVEGNTPAAVAAGKSGARGFLRSLAMLDPAARFHVVNPYARRVPATEFDGAQGIVFTGAGEPWGVTAPEAAPQRAAMETALASGLPVWGSCNGMQLAAVVAGGRVGPSPRGTEVGVARDIRLTAEGRAHPMLSGRTDGFAVPCIHRDEVRRLPAAARLLAGNDHSPVQAMSITADGVDFRGTQYHPELTPGDIADYVRANGIFAALAGLEAVLDAAESDPAAARRLGTSPQELSVDNRTAELRAWLRHVADRAGTAPAVASPCPNPAAAGMMAPEQGHHPCPSFAATA
ncbi:MAG: type 1 glutamine amidotransferase [Roseovarius sp.]|nr:type 1 glutamine amidotransferase [Roseovarius sp.]